MFVSLSVFHAAMEHRIDSIFTPLFSLTNKLSIIFEVTFNLLLLNCRICLKRLYIWDHNTIILYYRANLTMEPGGMYVWLFTCYSSAWPISKPYTFLWKHNIRQCAPPSSKAIRIKWELSKCIRAICKNSWYYNNPGNVGTSSHASYDINIITGTRIRREDIKAETHLPDLKNKRNIKIKNINLT